MAASVGCSGSAATIGGAAARGRRAEVPDRRMKPVSRGFWTRDNKSEMARGETTNDQMEFRRCVGGGGGNAAGSSGPDSGITHPDMEGHRPPGRQPGEVVP